MACLRFTTGMSKENTVSKEHGKKWPWIIMGSILAVVGLSYWTVQLALNNPVQMSDLDMQYYQHFDRDANKIIEAKIAFDRRYDITYVTEQFTPEAAAVRYKITDKAGNPVNDATVRMMLTRPNNHDSDMTLENPAVADGIYTFETVTLPKAGRWDVLAHFVVGDDQRYLNLKADTRYPNVFEY